MSSAPSLLLSACVSVLVALTTARAADPPTATAAVFDNVAARTGLEDVRGARVSFADLDGDLWPDLIVGCSRIFWNRPGAHGRRFVASGITLVPDGARGAQSVQIGDVNDDGHADLFLGRSTDLSNPRFTDDGLRSEIWLGDGKGGFRRVPEAGIERPETVISALFVDYDRDGRLDLFTGASYTAYGKSLEAFPDRLYRGKGDGRFVEVTKQAGLLGLAAWGRADSRRPTYGVAHTDWNNDGWQDLLTMSYGRQWNRLWRNNGDGTFTDLAPQTGFDGDAIRDGRYPPVVKRPTERPFRANGNTFDAAVADYDNDGDMDVFLAEITHWWAGPSSDRSMLLENLGPEHGYRFRRRPDLIPRTHFAERWNQGDMHAGWLDVDNDGLLDLVIASSDYPDLQRLQLYHQRPDHTFEDWSDRLGLTWRNAAAISFADFDGDGGVDIAVTTNNHRLTREQRRSHPLAMGLLRNLEARRTGHHWIELRLRGAGAGKANRDAIGARVVLWTGDRRQTREVYGGQGHAGHRDDTTLHFGLGKARHADRIEVHWPDASGSVQRFEHVAADRLYLLEQGGRLRTIRR